MVLKAVVSQQLVPAKNGTLVPAFEIMVLTQSASDTLYQYFGQHGEKVVQPLVDKLDKQKQVTSLRQPSVPVTH